MYRRCYRRSVGTEMLLLGFWEGVLKGPKRPRPEVKDLKVVVAGFRRCGLYPLDSMTIEWSLVMPYGPWHGTSSPFSHIS
ncbi:hypothetical protein EYF80_011950 [Liparis tanakae]|uniref:Uncharacterized protein n=1 Tax=Liparis tanakae TaxID=230148 RepID=A0A4Z2IL31_9TELE|nr:hypothetical protein EYF80_011950 [Liparis tanakae]